MEGPEARRRRPASSDASPAQEAAHMYAGGCARGRGLVSSERGTDARRRPASGGRGSSPVTGEQGRGFLARVRWRRRDRTRGERRGLGRRGDTGRHCFCWAGPYPRYRYVSTGVLKNCEINKKSDTLQIRIGRVSDAYPYRIRIRHAIRSLSHVSV